MFDQTRCIFGKPNPNLNLTLTLKLTNSSPNPNPNLNPIASVDKMHIVNLPRST